MMETIRELTMLAVVLRSALSIVLGGTIGFERGMKNRPAGMRTYMLVRPGGMRHHDDEPVCFSGV